MTYDLDLSLDNEIDVDRGFLLVTDIGTVRRVQVLKIVSFTRTCGTPSPAWCARSGRTGSGPR